MYEVWTVEDRLAADGTVQTVAGYLVGAERDQRKAHKMARRKMLDHYFVVLRSERHRLPTLNAVARPAMAEVA